MCRFARDAALLQRVGSVLLPPASAASTPLRRWLVARDAFALAQPATSSAIYNALAGERLSRVTAVLGQPTELELAGAALAAEGLERLEQWWDVFRITQVWRSSRGACAWLAFAAQRRRQQQQQPGEKNALCVLLHAAVCCMGCDTVASSVHKMRPHAGSRNLGGARPLGQRSGAAVRPWGCRPLQNGVGHQ